MTQLNFNERNRSNWLIQEIKIIDSYNNNINKNNLTLILYIQSE